MAGLIITNGDSAAELLAAAGRDGLILPWRDVLHEGPIVAGPLETSSAARAVFLAGRFRMDAAEIAREFAERDAILRGADRFDRIELWFEHDLYDQLQLVQILSVLSDARRQEGIVLVQADDFLGHQAPDTILRFAAAARPISEDDLDLADLVWADLAMPTPEAIAWRLEGVDDTLPFLRRALHRFLEELPGRSGGLTRSEATALAALGRAPMRPGDLFRAVLAAEDAAFMGDLSFFRLLDDLAFAEHPLVEGWPMPETRDGIPGRRDTRIALTSSGEAVLAGEADHVALNGIDRWWGGTRLLGRSVWRFDRDEMRLAPPEPPGA